MAKDGVKLKQAVGNVVTGDRFWGRKMEMELFIQRVDAGAHQLLIAQRRMGKTSLLREAEIRLKDRYICLFIDLQKAKSGPDMVVELSKAIQPYKSLWDKAGELFKNIFKTITDNIEKIGMEDFGITLRAGLTSGNWTEKGDKLFAILAESDTPVLLLMDEVPILVNRMLKGDDFIITPERRAMADEFMSWLRKNSNQHQGKIRLVVTGSIGLEPVLRQAHLSATINNFMPFDLKPWDMNTAIGCIEALGRGNGIDFDDGVPLKMVEKLGCCIPHHVQMFFSHIHEHCMRCGSKRCTTKMINDVYKREMLGTRGHAELTHYEERLQQVLGKELFSFIIDMVTEAAVTGYLDSKILEAFRKEHKKTIDEQREILHVLVHDGYLDHHKGRYIFVSNLVRDWWKGRHQHFFTPIMKRGC